MRVDRSWLVQAIRREVLSASASINQVVRISPSLRELLTEADYSYIRNEAGSHRVRVVIDPSLK